MFKDSKHTAENGKISVNRPRKRSDSTIRDLYLFRRGQAQEVS